MLPWLTARATLPPAVPEGERSERHEGQPADREHQAARLLHGGVGVGALLAAPPFPPPLRASGASVTKGGANGRANTPCGSVTSARG
jgi:hypothetical protein